VEGGGVLAIHFLYWNGRFPRAGVLVSERLWVGLKKCLAVSGEVPSGGGTCGEILRGSDGTKHAKRARKVLKGEGGQSGKLS